MRSYMIDKRRHPRIPMKCRVKIQHPSIGEVVFDSSDISDSGIFLLTGKFEELELGAIVKGQVQGMVVDAPVLDMRVVRITSEGVGLCFCDE